MMDYGPDWPARRATPPKARCGQVTYQMLVAALLMLGWLALWRASAPMRLNLSPEPPTTYATTTVGPPAHHAR